jgi:hypothetical protein
MNRYVGGAGSAAKSGSRTETARLIQVCLNCHGKSSIARARTVAQSWIFRRRPGNTDTRDVKNVEIHVCGASLASAAPAEGGVAAPATIGVSCRQRCSARTTNAWASCASVRSRSRVN